MEYHIDRVSFVAWLTKDVDRIFRPKDVGDGMESWSCGCPLAEFSRETFSLPLAAFAGNYLYPERRVEGKVEQEAWTRYFVRRFDMISPPRKGADAISVMNSL